MYSLGREMDQGTYIERIYRCDDAGRAGVAELLAEPAEHTLNQLNIS